MTYRVDVERDEAGYWIADAPEVSGAHTFARRLDQIPERLAEAIAVALDVGDVDVKLDVHLSPELEEAVSGAHASRQAAELAANNARDATRRAARVLLAAHFSRRDAGALLGISHQRVDQLLKT
ncbi:MAG: type II toxin-antitoxin system HicB family antitoxin [Acidimicrobiia bacterium]